MSLACHRETMATVEFKNDDDGKPLEIEVETSQGSEAKANLVEVEVALPMGFWIEDSPFDKFDKSLSMHVFKLEFSRNAETFLAIPGTWFGLPVPAFILSNLLTWYAHFAQQAVNDASWLVSALGLGSKNHWIVSFLHQFGVASDGSFKFFALSTFFLTIWGVVFLRFWYTGHVEKAYLLNKHWMFPSLALPIGLGRMYSPEGYRAAMFFIVSWMVAQSVSSALKTAFSRTRPSVAKSTAELIKKVNRAFPTYRAMLSIGESVFESFPSGDSVGAACFSATLYILKAPTWTVLICVLTAFCRMYFHAHHLFDVFAGLALGWMVTLGLNATFGYKYFDLPHTAAVTVAFIIFIVRLQKFKPALPAHMRVEGRKGF